jgi:uncharacterized protein
MEYASFSLKELKFDNVSAETMTFTGYGAVFNNIDSYGDMIMPGAFADSLAKSKASGVVPAMLLNHGGWGTGSEDMLPIGVWNTLSEDGHGLLVEGKLAPTARGKDSYELLKMGAVNGLSIGYIAKSFEPRSTPEDPKRRLTKVDLMEVSLVTFPANPKARVSSVKTALTIRDAERSLREAGFSREESKRICAIGFKKDANLRDAGDSQEDVAEDLRRLINSVSGKGS